MRFPHFYSKMNPLTALIVIFVVLALIGLFNAYKMGFFRRKRTPKNKD